MRIISIDVGIKNLALCLFEKQHDTELKIIKWDIVNLSEEFEAKSCCEKNKGKPCTSEAKFTKNSMCYCLKHAKKQEFLLPVNDLKANSLNKMKVKDLFTTTEKYNLPVDAKSKKTELLSILQQFATEKCFEPINKTNSSHIDLVTIGRNIKIKLDKLFKDDIQNPITHVVIENQISPIANRMKTIQGMIAQYFIMKNTNVQIDFISAANKLKDMNGSKASYSERKKLGIQKCQEFLDQDPGFLEWEPFFKTHKKKDDLADSFLQGIWFINNKLLK